MQVTHLVSPLLADVCQSNLTNVLIKNLNPHLLRVSSIG